MPNAIISKSNVRNMFRTSWLTTLMSSAVCALVATSTIGEAAFAQIPGAENFPLLPGQRRVTYKISDINPSDAERFCKSKYGQNASFRLEPESDRVFCGRRQTNSELQLGTSGVNLTIPTEQWGDNPHQLNDLCNYKHPGKGTWVGDGGRSCYDSYRTF